MVDLVTVTDTASLERAYLQNLGKTVLSIAKLSERTIEAQLRLSPPKSRAEFDAAKSMMGMLNHLWMHVDECGYSHYIAELDSLPAGDLETQVKLEEKTLQKSVENILEQDLERALAGKYYGLEVSRKEATRQTAQTINELVKINGDSKLFSLPFAVYKETADGNGTLYYGAIRINPCELFEKMPKPDEQASAQKDMERIRAGLGLNSGIK